MKKYKYRFQSLLRIRELQEEMAVREFREAVRLYAEAVEALDGLRGEKTGLLDEMLHQRSSGTDLKIQQLYLDYLKALDGRIDDQRAEVDRCNQTVEERREELIESMRERKTLESLHVKDHERYLVDLRRWEQSILDELALLRHGRESVINGM